jgi:membrane-bound lytic murein transglycosylase A
VPSDRPASRDSSPRPRLRPADIVHQTIASPADSATSASRRIHSIARPFPFALAVAGVLALVACTTTPPSPPASSQARITRAAWSDLPGFAQDPVHEAWPSFVAGCRALVARPASAAVWRAPCEAARSIDGNDARAVREFVVANLSPWRVAAADGRDEGLVTGYYEAKLDGARVRTERFAVPLLGRPDDLLAIDVADVHPELAGRRVRGRLDGSRVVSYWPRADIVRGKAKLDRHAIAWVADPLDAFFLEVQGSGRIALPDGTTMRVGYADQNGHPYRAIGRVLVERGEMALEQVSLQSIRDWARRHPDELAALLDENPSYVFFREMPAPAPGSPDAAIDGPIGSLGVPLAAGRAIAVDATIVPLGAPVWLSIAGGEMAVSRLVLAQDTGGAIRGAVRADLFVGYGGEAMERAGRMRERGRLWILWPTAAPPPPNAMAAMPQ